MATDMAINLGQLQELVEQVQKTKQAHTVRLADGVVAVVKPDRRAIPHRSERPGKRSAAVPRYTLESAYGAVADAGGPRDFDHMIRDVKEERAVRLQATQEQDALS